MSSSSGFIPTKFSNYGKSSKDLFKKKYEFDHIIKTVNKSSRKGVSVESGAVFPSDSNPVRGFIKGKYSNFGIDSFYKGGEFEFEFSTDPSQESKANCKFNNLAKGFGLNLLTSSKSSDKSFKRPIIGVELDYSQEYVTVNANAKSDLDIHKIDSSISIGYDNISVGSSAVLDISRGSEVVEHNIGAEYIAEDFVAAVYTEKNSKSLTASYYQKINRDQAIGAQFKYDLTGRNERSLAVGTEYRVDLDTSIKAKVELPSGDIATSIEHRLANPKLLLGLSAQFNAKSQRFQADKLGVSITFGDY